jgi:hypothetical protein
MGLYQPDFYKNDVHLCAQGAGTAMEERFQKTLKTRILQQIMAERAPSAPSTPAC